MPGLKKQPPLPTWKGTPADLAEAFIEFARRNSAVQLANRRTRIERDIANRESNKSEAIADARRMRQTVVRIQQEIDALTTSLVDTTDLSIYTEGLVRLMDHPSVIGIRADSKGRLVIHVRLFKNYDGEERFIGDFELSLHTGQLDSSEEQLLVCQTDISSTDHWALAPQCKCGWDGVVYGYITNYHPIFQPLLQSGDLVGVIDTAIEYLSVRARSKTKLQLSEEMPRPAWTGITSGIEQALANTLEWSINRPVRHAITGKTERLQGNRRDMAYYTTSVRNYNTALSRLRAELAGIVKAQEGVTFDEGTSREQLRYITSLPGVMGVKFIDDDEIGRVPVFHVRATMVYQGMRYDMGDYEIEFRTHTQHAAVVCVNQTRTTRGGHGGPYYHPGSPRGWYASEYRNRSWFCFGDRAGDLAQLFQDGNYGEFMHLAINSLNSINAGSEYYIGEYFERIDMDAVWTPVTQTVRARRRRRLTDLLTAVL
jgi:hypothetical protein